MGPDFDEGGPTGREGGDGTVGQAAIRWSAIVFIVVAILYFLARYVIPLI